MRNKADILEQLQSAIDRRDVDSCRALGHPRVYVLRGGMAEFDDGFEHELALRREAVATRSKLGLEVLHRLRLPSAAITSTADSRLRGGANSPGGAERRGLRRVGEFRCIIGV